MRKTGFIFDLDGTLFDSESQISHAINKVRRNKGYPNFEDTELSALIGLSAVELVRDLQLPRNEEVELVKDFREELAIEIARENIMFRGARDFIKMARHIQLPIGIATSKPTYLARAVIENSKISHLVQHVQGTDNFPPKPDPSVIVHCMKSLGVQRALMFGDRREDMLSAQSAGVIGIGISQTFHTPGELIDAGATLVFASFIEAQDKIQDLVEMAES